MAETYRKIGMTDKAMEILSQGIRFHPAYVMGYLGLAFCYYDLKQYNLAYSTLRALVDSNRDNIRLQKLFGDICLELGHREEALETFKYLLFVNPKDKEVAGQVQRLEAIIEDQYKPKHQPIFIPERELTSTEKIDKNSIMFDIDKLDNRPNSSTDDYDNWVSLDLGREQKVTKNDDPYEFWNVKKSESSLTSKPEQFYVDDQDEENQDEEIFEEEDLGDDLSALIAEASSSKLQTPTLELVFTSDDYTDENEEEDSDDDSSSIPLVTHTLVDLYCGQGHIEKALEVLEKILLLNPSDKKTIDKIAEIKSLMLPHMEEAYEASEDEDLSEEDGRKNLMDIFDQRVATASIPNFEPVVLESKERNVAADKVRILEEKLGLFLKKIQKRALDYQARL